MTKWRRRAADESAAGAGECGATVTAPDPGDVPGATPPSDPAAADRRPAGRPPREGPLEPHTQLQELQRGRKPGSRYYRLIPREKQVLRHVAPGEYEATAAILQPKSGPGRFRYRLRRALIGAVLPSKALPHQRLGKAKGLAIYASDNLSSSAYATEEILLALILAGTLALDRTIPIAIVVVALMAIIVTSYRQTIRAYPNGGGAYIVAKDNLGVWPSLVAGGALLVDYVLTVAVSVAAGVAAITSAVPELHSVRVEISVVVVVLLMLTHLRGIRESGNLFVIPVFLFIFVFGALIVVGLIRLALGHDLQAGLPTDPIIPGTGALTIFVLLRAFASGNAAVTGIEAVANGVPNFKPPEAKNAAAVQLFMVGLLAFFFMGTAILAQQMGVQPSESKTVVAQIAQTVFGHNVLFFLVQAVTALILLLAANTSFADLPVLSSVMARDSVLPRQFAFRGDRLAFSNGILVLAGSSIVLLIAFRAETHLLIPLYAVGVFSAITLSQAGMVVHWWRLRGSGWRRSLIVNAVGAAVTLIVTVIIAATKFLSGAWLSIVVMVLLVLLLWRIRGHYRSAKEQLDPGPLGEEPLEYRAFLTATAEAPVVIIPVDEINMAVLRSVAYARAMASNVTAIHVTDDRERGEALRREWEERVPTVPIVVVESPYRSIVAPILAYVDALDRATPNQLVAVVVPEFIPRWPWQRLLYNQLARRLRSALFDRPNTVIVDIPYHLRH